MSDVACQSNTEREGVRGIGQCLTQLRGNHHDRCHIKHREQRLRVEERKLVVCLKRDFIAVVGRAAIDEGAHELVLLLAAGSARARHADGVLPLGVEGRQRKGVVAAQLRLPVPDHLNERLVALLTLDELQNGTHHDEAFDAAVERCRAAADGAAKRHPP